jgi:hypothetical protein
MGLSFLPHGDLKCAPQQMSAHESVLRLVVAQRKSYATNNLQAARTNGAGAYDSRFLEVLQREAVEDVWLAYSTASHTTSRYG